MVYNMWHTSCETQNPRVFTPSSHGSTSVERLNRWKGKRVFVPWLPNKVVGGSGGEGWYYLEVECQRCIRVYDWICHLENWIPWNMVSEYSKIPTTCTCILDYLVNNWI